MARMLKIKQLLKQWVIPPAPLRVWQLLFASKKCDSFTKEQKILLDENKIIKDRHCGQRCFILGAGSSVKKQDLTKLDGECILAVSNTFVHPDYPTIKPQYHILPSVIGGHGKLYSLEKFVDWFREMEQKTLDAEMFLHIGDKDIIDNNGLFKDKVIHWNEYVPWDEKCDFPLDISHVPSVWSVSEFAITVALYLGFDKIYLLGFDHDWFNGPLVYFYDYHTEHKLEPSAEKLLFADAEFQMLRHARIFKKYKCLYQMKQNIYNANADPNHYMDVFPKVDYNSLFGE